MSRDRTARNRALDSLRQTLHALRESEERYRALVETTYDWIWEVDADGRYTYVSPRVKDTLGYDPMELLGRTPFDLMPEAEAARVRGIFQETKSRREAISGLENINLHKDGQQVILESSALPMFGPRGELLGYRGVDRDITARRRAEDDRRRMDAKITQVQKLESMGGLSCEIAHHFNNLLVGIMGNIELARLEIAEDSPGCRWLRQAELACEQAAELCREMLAYAATGRGKAAEPATLDDGPSVRRGKPAGTR